MGGYTANGNQLQFGQMAGTKIAGTRMACAQGMDIERDFLQALSQVKRWKIADGKLELFDSAGKLLAKFESSSN